LSRPLLPPIRRLRGGNDLDAGVRSTVAYNKATPVEALARLADDLQVELHRTSSLLERIPMLSDIHSKSVDRNGPG